MARVTRKDIAQEAGVTETIVSYVLNGNRYVNKDKKARVLDAVKKLGYSPSPMARALKGKNSDHILFIADDLMSEHFGTIIGEMEKLASENGILVSLVSDRGDENFVKRVINWSFDGIIIGSASVSNNDIQTLINTGTPVILLAINKYPQFEGNYGLINTGLYRGAKEVINRFIKNGRHKIAYACFDEKANEFNKNDNKYLGYKDYIINEEIIAHTIHSSDLMQDEIKKLYKETKFDALLARTDNTALVAITALKDLGLKIPEDVAVVGFNDSKVCNFTFPTLSSVRIKRREIAKHAMQLLTILQKGEQKGVIVAELDTEVIERESFHE